MAGIRAKIGDCLQVPLPDGRFAYAQYVSYHHQYGTLVRVFDVISDQPLPVDRLLNAKLLFAPSFVIFSVALRQKHWSVVGPLPADDFKFPIFRCTQLFTDGLKPGTYDDWWLWDGETYTPIGTLPPEYHRLEYLALWPANRFEARIATGECSPYDSMF